ncbi:STM4504/CBY_0614 family protein [Caballeronia sp. GAFFF1]|uniref:STM4504/CBY_0614 family protein n=1 Tax=Caballeronia sp. GAFFF1 TaxID=2921779 RepID=UPI002028B576|nr:hypothetical protein [Caballeronia sp. GAFFF1]
MVSFNLFSKRQKRARGEMPDVYVYDSLPRELRVQIVQIIEDAFGQDTFHSSHATDAYEFVKRTLCREYGVFELTKNAASDAESVFNFFLWEENIEQALDVIELSFKVVTHISTDQDYKQMTRRRVSPEDAIVELNERFKEHGVGYTFESNEILRIDSQYLHAEAVKPALSVLRGSAFQGANEEFLLAHEHYRHGRHKECLVDALKALESTMKSIAKQRRWATKPGDTAKALIAACFSNGLLPPYLESQFAALRTLLESGLPTVRNKLGGHGQGTDPLTVPAYFARYALNLTATSILFLVEANAALN